MSEIQSCMRQIEVKFSQLNIISCYKYPALRKYKFQRSFCLNHSDVFQHTTYPALEEDFFYLY